MLGIRAVVSHPGNYITDRQAGLSRNAESYTRCLETVPNLQLAGRNGMHRYDNQDHAMLTGILAARNILGARYNVWDMQVGDGHHEEGDEITDSDLAALEATQPLTPESVIYAKSVSTVD